MSDVQLLVRRFYDEIWNQQQLSSAEDLLADDLSFRGSLGPSLYGRSQFLDYVTSLTRALSNYRCEIKELVTMESRAAARMTFTGIHVGDFLGYSPTHQTVEWNGAAFFTERRGKLSEIWVLGDLFNLTQLLEKQSRAK